MGAAAARLTTWNLWAFLAALLVYHASEFLLAAIYMRHELGWSSLLITKPYAAAMAAALLEHALWAWLLPWLHRLDAVALAGLALVVLGEALRKAAMVTAKGAFTHKIRVQRSPEHQLVTHGVYRHVRHPGYLGWFLWSVGTQVLLVNPVCVVAFAVMAWGFFSERIEYEEAMLVHFFGPEYELYRARTPTWIPGIP